MIVVENPDTVKYIKKLETAIQRVREVTNQYIEHGDFVEKETALDILKALDGEQ